jgi:NAD(P)H-hydrate epimerase
LKEYILTNREAHLVDQYAINNLGIPGLTLMKRAGDYASLRAKEMLKGIPNNKIEIFCGIGNNGGDGFVVANNLAEWGANVSIWVVGDPSKIKGDALHFYKRCQQMNLDIKCLENESELTQLNITESDLIVDALLGTGFKGIVRGLMSGIIELINNSNQPVLSIDIPSGIDGDTGQVGGKAVKTSVTVTMGFFKRGLLFHPGKKYSGKVYLADLGYPEEAFKVVSNETFLIRKKDVEKALPLIRDDTYKHRQGKVLIFAGSPGMTGAATLTSKAAMRGGAGLVVTAIPESLNTILEVKLTEALTLPLPESLSHTFCESSLIPARGRIDWSDVVVFGPGISDCEEVRKFGTTLIEKHNRSFIVDADGLKIFRDNLDLIKQTEDITITPHYGEFSLITGIPINKIKENTIDTAREFVEKYPCTLVLKGSPTIVISKNGIVAVNSTGGPALATGGTGDVLTGLIAAFRAQGMNSFESSMVAVFIHGAAGDLGSKEMGIRGLVAGDLLKYIPIVLRDFDKVDI